MNHGRIVYLPQMNYQSSFLKREYNFNPDKTYYLNDTSSAYPLGEYACWDRWLLSHHCSFLMWSLAIYAFNTKDFNKAANYLLIYDEILTYTRVINPIDYDEQVRPIMATFWPGFSAVWSYEFQLLKSMMKDLPKSETYLDLHQAFKRCHQNHLATAKSLVPQGRSLLQEIKKAGKMQPTSSESLNFVYDCVFLIQRKDISPSDLELQVLAKFKVLIDDARFLEKGSEIPLLKELFASLTTKWIQ